jgi:HK97 family phage portal protein
VENFITRTFGRIYRSTVGKLGPAKDWQLWQSITGAFSGKEVAVTQKSVLSIPAYWRAVDLIATQVASLPFNVYTVDSDGKISEARTNPIWRVLNYRPSPEYDYFTFMEAIMRIMLTGTVGYAPGNCLIHIIRDNRGAVTYLDLIHEQFEIVEAESGLIYLIGNAMIPAADIIHIKAWTKNGLEGDSPLKALNSTFKRGISEISTFTDFYKNGANVSGLLETDSPLNPTQRKELEDAWARNYSGVANQGKTALLSHGVKYKTIGTRLNESDLSSRRMTVEDIANITGVPLPLLSSGDKTPLNNLEVLNRLFVQYTLRAWCKRIESEFNSKLFSVNQVNTTFVRFNLDGLLRGDTQSRANYYKELYNIRALSPNEIRALENMNPYDGGDQYGMPLASNSTEPAPQNIP